MRQLEEEDINGSAELMPEHASEMAAGCDRELRPDELRARWWRAVRTCRWLMLVSFVMWVGAAVLPASIWRFQLFVLPNVGLLMIAYAFLADSRPAVTFGVANLIAGPVMILLSWMAPQASRIYAGSVAALILPVIFWFCWWAWPPGCRRRLWL